MTKTVSKMSEENETDKLSVFIAAARDNNLSEMEKLCGRKLLLNSSDDENRTALHWAVDREHIGRFLSDVLWPLLFGYFCPPNVFCREKTWTDMMKLLLSSGSDPNLKDIDGCTPLHYAATAESEIMIKLLLENGAKKDIPDIDGSLPVDYSERETVQNLLQWNSLLTFFVSDF